MVNQGGAEVLEEWMMSLPSDTAPVSAPLALAKQHYNQVTSRSFLSLICGSFWRISCEARCEAEFSRCTGLVFCFIILIILIINIVTVQIDVI